MTALTPIAAGDYQVIVQVYTIQGEGFENVQTAESEEYALVERLQISAAVRPQSCPLA